MNNAEMKKTLAISLSLTAVLSCVCFVINIACGIICAALGVALTAVFAFYTKKRYDRLNELNTYLSLVCAGNYNLDINENTEGELSILKNNLFKVITILQSQKDCLQKDKLYLSDSLADISHQLKTPLTSMMVMTELLKTENDAEKRAEFLNVTENQLDKMKWLITNLLKLSKLDAGTAEFNIQKISSNDIINRSLNPFLITLDLKDITLVNTATDFEFDGDANWSVEALENIIKNCMEHTDKNGTIEISSNHSNIYDEIIIKDDGCGIAPEDLPHIFERFYHGKNSSNESVGIGLALAQAVINREHGEISVTSEIGRGSEFKIKFYKSIV